MDSQSLFLVEPVPGTTFMYLLPEGHLSKYNSNGQLSWVLSLLSNGRFIGNGHRDVLSQWALIADTPPTGEGNITLGTNSTILVYHIIDCSHIKMFYYFMLNFHDILKLVALLHL